MDSFRLLLPRHPMFLVLSVAILCALFPSSRHSTQQQCSGVTKPPALGVVHVLHIPHVLQGRFLALLLQAALQKLNEFSAKMLILNFCSRIGHLAKNLMLHRVQRKILVLLIFVHDPLKHLYTFSRVMLISRIKVSRQAACFHYD